jgi:hypothetical protein
MIRLSILIFTCTIWVAQTAQAGAWLRERGAGFLSTSGTVTAEKDASGALYGEFGLTDRMTLGIDINGGMDRDGLPQGDGTLFLRFPLSDTEAPHKFAAHVGLGARYEPYDLVPSLELGLSWGRGFQWRERWGWAALDASINLAEAPIKTITKLDATLGIGLGQNTKAMGQIFLTRTDGRLYTTLAPSLLVTPKASRTTFQIGFEFPMEAENDARLKLGIWRTF